MQLLIIALLLAAPVFVQAQPLNALTDAYVYEAGRAPAVVVARITSEDIERAVSGPESVDASSLFEIGSITKVFTGILLADLVKTGKVRLDTTIGELLDERWMLDPAVASITLHELSTHTSGLPRLPTSGRMMARLLLRSSDPYRGLTTEQLFEELAAIGSDRLERRSQMQYSNFAFAVLGRLLEQAAGAPYEELIEQRVLNPLELDGMGFTELLTSDPALIDGHRNNLQPAHHWHFGSYAPAGGMAGSLSQLEHFLLAAMSAEPGSALSLSIEEGLGWAHSDHDDRQLIWHNGQTGGFHAFVGFYRDGSQGIVALSNASNSLDDFALGLLQGNNVPEAPKPNWFLLGLTVLFTPLGAFLLLAFIKNPESRLHGLDALLASAFMLSVTWKLGAWTHVPLLFWYLATLATLVIAVWAIPQLVAAPWKPKNRPLASAGKAVSVLTYIVLLAWVIAQL